MPAVCNDTEFRQMWTEFEWENKVMFLSVAKFKYVDLNLGFFLGFCFY